MTKILLFFHYTPVITEVFLNFENFVPLLIISILNFKAQRQSIYWWSINSLKFYTVKVGWVFFFLFKTVLSFPVLKRSVLLLLLVVMMLSFLPKDSFIVPFCILVILVTPYNSYSLPGLLISQTLERRKKKKKERKKKENSLA